MTRTVPEPCPGNLDHRPSCRTPRTRPATAPAPVAPTEAPDAACRDAELDLFFDGRYVAFAKALCARCPIQQACLSYALARAVDGVWGGTTRAERVGLRHQRGVTAASLAWSDTERSVLVADRS